MNIRTLKLEPGYNDADLVGELPHNNLEKFSEYDAISYTWGDETGDNQACRQIYIQNNEILSYHK
jgi:hypothetical protein